MKNFQKSGILVLLVVLASGVLLSACSAGVPAASTAEAAPTSTNEDLSAPSSEENPKDTNAMIESENTESDVDEPEIAADDFSASGLSQAEIDSLLFMREEEKLAHDVYLALYEAWGLPLFENIAGSEQKHTEAVKGLLDKYGLPDPADTSPAGVFVNPDLQQLYDDLTEAGKASLAEALKVGAAIEEIDILDLQEALIETGASDIQRVYENLLKGSENHLRAFTSTLLRQTGETYQPQYLSQAAYEAIVNGDNARGGGNGRGGGRRP